MIDYLREYIYDELDLDINLYNKYHDIDANYQECKNIIEKILINEKTYRNTYKILLSIKNDNLLLTFYIYLYKLLLDNIDDNYLCIGKFDDINEYEFENTTIIELDDEFDDDIYDDNMLKQVYENINPNVKFINNNIECVFINDNNILCILYSPGIQSEYHYLNVNTDNKEYIKIEYNFYLTKFRIVEDFLIDVINGNIIGNIKTETTINNGNPIMYSSLLNIDNDIIIGTTNNINIKNLIYLLNLTDITIDNGIYMYTNDDVFPWLGKLYFNLNNINENIKNNYNSFIEIHYS